MIKKKLADKFYGNKPLCLYPKYYPDNLLIRHNKISWIPHEMDFFIHTMRGEKLERKESDGPLMFAIAGKEEKLKKYDFLSCPDGPAFVVHGRVVEKLQELCPDDFQAFPVLIRNLKETDEYFENKDFYLINILHVIDAIDRQETIIEDWGDGVFNCENIHFKEDCMQGHLIARSNLIKATKLFAPKLAIEFIKSKPARFLSEEELPDKPHRTDLWAYINRFYRNILKENNLYEEFISYNGYKKVPQILEKLKDQILLNYCPNCGNLKLTPKARQCLKCGKFIDPVNIQSKPDC